MQTAQTSRIKQTRELAPPDEEKQPLTDLDPDLLTIARTFSRRENAGQEESVKALKDISATLKRFKLTKNEAKVYLYLARYGAQKAQKIAESLGVHRTEAYKILRTLENEGIICKVLERPMKFTAVPFEKVLNNEIEERRQRIFQLERRKEELVRLWQTLPHAEESEGEKETLQVLEGKRQISAKINDLLKGTERRLQAIVSDRHLIWLYNSPFFDDLAEISKKKDMDVRIMTQYTPTSTYILEQVGGSCCDFAFLQVHDQPSFILGDKGSMILLIENEDKFYAMETNYDSLVKSYRNLFDLLWKSQPQKPAA